MDDVKIPSWQKQHPHLRSYRSLDPCEKFFDRENSVNPWRIRCWRMSLVSGYKCFRTPITPLPVQQFFCGVVRLRILKDPKSTESGALFLLDWVSSLFQLALHFPFPISSDLYFPICSLQGSFRSFSSISIISIREIPNRKILTLLAKPAEALWATQVTYIRSLDQWQSEIS